MLCRFRARVSTSAVLGESFVQFPSSFLLEEGAQRRRCLLTVTRGEGVAAGGRVDQEWPSQAWAEIAVTFDAQASIL